MSYDVLLNFVDVPPLPFPSLPFPSTHTHHGLWFLFVSYCTAFLSSQRRDNRAEFIALISFRIS
jgi:hypothetical protein